jgi:hypothetical protein
LRIGQATPWANLDKALERANVDEMCPEAIWAFLDLEEGGEKRVELFDNSILTKYSPTVKSFRVTGGTNGPFKEYASFCMHWMLLQQSLYGVTKARRSIIIAGWENRALDLAVITSEALI